MDRALQEGVTVSPATKGAQSGVRDAGATPSGLREGAQWRQASGRDAGLGQ